ncbi:MAG TPA: lasso peptide biosynthesis B2 protein [Caulobacter sp.]|nr:lasso peptide biosynthesis B2 protein [Caulobacter sp.]
MDKRQTSVSDPFSQQLVDQRRRRRSLTRRWAALSWSDRALLVEATAMVTFGALAVRLLPFRRVVTLASGRGGPPSGRSDWAGAAARVAWAVRAAGRRAPFRVVCFQEGLAAHWMLRRRGAPSQLHYGAALDRARGLSSHVWVTVGETDVVGCELAGDYRLLASFPPG